MAGENGPKGVGANREKIDEGTSALMCMPAPALMCSEPPPSELMCIEPPLQNTKSVIKAPVKEFNSKVVNRFFDLLDVKLSKMTKDVGVDDWKYIAGLSALESGYLNDHNLSLNNPFGLTKAGGNNIKFSSIDASITYWISQYGGQVKGAVSAIDFVQRCEGVLNGKPVPGWHKYNTVNAAWEKSVIGAINSVEKRRNIWLEYVIQRDKKGK